MNSRGQGLYSHKDTVPNKMQYFLQAMLMANPYKGVPKDNVLADRNKVLSILHETKYMKYGVKIIAFRII